eukprot:6270031-Alexandrium_andersonii.AAC.1
MGDFYAKFKRGKRKDLREGGGEGSFIVGRHARQLKDFGVVVSMDHYSKKLKPVGTPKGLSLIHISEPTRLALI